MLVQLNWMPSKKTSVMISVGPDLKLGKLWIQAPNQIKNFGGKIILQKVVVFFLSTAKSCLQSSGCVLLCWVTCDGFENLGTSNIYFALRSTLYWVGPSNDVLVENLICSCLQLPERSITVCSLSKSLERSLTIVILLT